MTSLLTPDNTRTTVVNGRRVYLVKVAKAQRVLILLVVGLLLVNAGGVVLLLSVQSGVIAAGGFGGAWPFMAFASLNLLLVVCAIVQTVRLSVASGTHWGVAVFAGVLLLIPWLGLLVLVFINVYATRLLVNNAVVVGFFGVTAEEMKKLVIGACPTCGYDIRGLPTPQCPECGTQLALPASLASGVFAPVNHADAAGEHPHLTRPEGQFRNPKTPPNNPS